MQAHTDPSPDAPTEPSAEPTSGPTSEASPESRDAAGPGEEAARPAPKSSYELPNRRNTSVRNMVWALGVMMAVVTVVAIGFFGVGTDLGREVPENSRLDLAETAERARGSVDFPVAEPSPGDEWTVRDARVSAADPASWSIRYTAPSGSLVALEQQAEVSAPMLSAALPGTVVEEELEIDGAACQVLRSDESGSAARGLACEGEGWGILVHGDVEDAELRTLMESAIASLG